jgi:Uma2 family endonuclease
MTTTLDSSGSPRRVIPVGPSVEAWGSMSASEREQFLVEVLDALSDPKSAMTEGRPHKKAKARALDFLGLHFKTMGRTIYLAEEMAVVYPGEEAFSPDVLAVVGVEQPEDDERMAWVVADEHKGLDVVLEVLHRGDRNKDLVLNVERYARLGIPEYFVYDRARQSINAHRLASPGRYERIVPRSGRFTSMVLGIDLAVQGGKLRFFQGAAELFGTTELIGRLSGMVEDLTEKADAAVAQADVAARVADRALAGLRAGLLAALEARGIPCSDEARGRIAACDDPALLERWLILAMRARTVAEVFGAG